MTNPIPSQSELKQLKQGKVLSAKTKRPVQAVCHKVKDVVASDLNCHNMSLLEKEVGKAHIQEKKAKKIAYKRGNEGITLDELFLKQNGEKHG